MKRLALSIVLGLVCVTAASARDLTVVAWGGSTQAAQRKLFYEPFMKSTGIKLLEDSWSGGIGILRTKIQGGNANWDVVQVEVDELGLGCTEGLYEKMDWKLLGGEDKFLKDAVHECGVGAVLWSTALTYDADKLKEAPQNWADFWDVKKFPGKRSLRKGAKYNLEFALMADGVPLADVYKVLGTPEGVDRAFKKLDELKPHIVWWTSGAQPIQLLASGEVVMTSSYTSRPFGARRQEGKNYNVVWNQSIYAIDFWVVLKGTPNKENAFKLVNFMTRPEQQRPYPNLSGSSVTNLEAIKGIDADVAPLLASYPDNMKVSRIIDSDFWIDNADQLTQRFNAWASR
ncbi:MAG: ABC transporter substrate-binding protein [Hyphomicrobiaceae bacterium]